jgi:hypothetical protein
VDEHNGRALAADERPDATTASLDDSLLESRDLGRHHTIRLRALC